MERDKRATLKEAMKFFEETGERPEDYELYDDAAILEWWIDGYIANCGTVSEPITVRA